MSVIISTKLKELLYTYFSLCDQCYGFCYHGAKYFVELYIEVWLVFKCFKLWYLKPRTSLAPYNETNFKHIKVVDSALLDSTLFKAFLYKVN